MMTFIEIFFQLNKNQTTIRTEIIAGLTTFITMAYIIFVNPQILSTTGMDSGAVFTATCLITAAATFLSALIANNPVAIAPGMTLNTVFAFVVVQAEGYDWQNALGMVFISGIIFVFLTLTKVRTYILKALPEPVNIGIITGISLFIALIALKNINIITMGSDHQIQLNNLLYFNNGMMVLGLIIMLLLNRLKLPGAILFGLIVLTSINTMMNEPTLPSIMSLPPSIKPVWMQLKFDQINSLHAYHQVFSFLLVALFDATGTLIGLLHTTAFSKIKHQKKMIERNLLADSIATTSASFIGTSSTSPFLESATGIEAGGRTGLAAVVIALLFIAALFFSPLLHLIPNFAVSAALLFIAISISQNFKRTDFKEFSHCIPTMVTMLIIPYSFSIADGIGAGLISYVILKLVKKEAAALNTSLLIVSFAFLLYFINALG